HEIPYIWPLAVEQQVARMTEEVPEEAKVGRVELRDLPLVTIEGEDARDLNYTDYCEKKLYVGCLLFFSITKMIYYIL
ncbi:hypothetical protein ACQWB2_26515, partial [Salmonella enterica subsp. enterica serovar Infantis]